MQYVIRVFALMCVAFFAALQAAVPAEARRVALVVGNADYKVGRLQNPINDATAVAEAFGRLGFDKVILKRNLSADAFRAALLELSREATGADLGVVYFAGHGTEVNGKNFLIPVDAGLAKAGDLSLEAIALDSVLDQLGGVSKLKLVILDACRNNIFPLAGAKRSVTRGLTRIEPEDNTLVVYAAKDGTTADDGAGRKHSPFTEALLKHIATPGLEISFVFRRVRDDVAAATSSVQHPHVYGTLGSKEFYLLPQAVAPAVSGPASHPRPVEAAERAWAAAKDSTSIAVLEAFRREYGAASSFYDRLAEARIGELKSKVASTTTGPPAEKKKSEPSGLPEHLKSDRFTVGLHAAHAIKEDSYRMRALIAIAEGQAKAGLTADSAATMAAAIADGRSSGDASRRNSAHFTVAISQTKAERFDEALQTVQSITTASSRSGALQEIAKAQAGAGLVSEAAGTFERAAEAALSIRAADNPGSTLSDEYLRVSALAWVASSQAKAGLKATPLLDKAAALANALTDRRDRRKALQSVASAQLEAGMSAEAAATLAAAAELPLPANVGSSDFSYFAGLQAKAGQKAEALASYRRAVEVELTSGRKKQYGAFSSLPYFVDSCAKAGLRDECAALLAPANDLARTTAAEWTRVSALVAKFETQLAPGKTRDAAATFAQLVAMAQVHFSEHKRVEALAAIGRAQTAAGRFDEAQTTFDLVERIAQALGDQSLRYSIDSIKKHSDLNKPERVRDAVRAIRDYWADRHPLLDIAKAQIKAGLTAEAAATFAHALKAARALTDEYIRAPSIADIAKAQAEVGNFVEALRIAASVSDTRDAGNDNSYDRWGTYKEIAEGQLKAGLATEAAATLDRALKVARASGDNHNRASLLAQTSKLLVKAGLTRDAAAALDEAVQAMRSEKMHGLTRSTLATIAEAQAVAGLVRETATTIDRVIEAKVDESGGYSFPSHAFEQIAIALAK